MYLSARREDPVGVKDPGEQIQKVALELRVRKTSSARRIVPVTGYDEHLLRWYRVHYALNL